MTAAPVSERVYDRVLVVATSLIYIGAVHWSYQTIISPLFDYNGALYRPAPDGSLVFAFLVSVLPAFWLPVAVTRPSQVVLWVVYILSYVPSILFPYYVLGTGFEGVLPLTVAIGVSFAALSLMVYVRLGFTYAPARSMRSFETLALGLALALGAYIILAFGLNLDLPNLANVYDVRSSFDAAVADTRLPFTPYAVDWSLYIANPLLMLLGLRSRRFGLLFIGLAIELLVYGTTGYKSALLSMVLLIPLLALLSRPLAPAFGLSLPTASVILVLGSILWDKATDSTVATFLFIHRLIALPGQLVADYYDFFSQHRTYELTHSILSFLGPAPWDLPPPKLIGAVYFDAPSENANANLWADAYANFGTPGILVFTIVLGLVLVLFDSAALGRDLRVSGPLAGLMAIVLSNSALLTTILTHGLALAVVLLYLMPQEQAAQTEEVPRASPLAPPYPLPITGPPGPSIQPWT